MRPFRLPPSRRAVLRGVLSGAAVSIGLPMLECMLDRTGRAYADGSVFPKRFALFYWGNGMLPERWTPATTGALFAPSDELLPLLPVLDRVTVVTGTEVRVANRIPHMSGPGGFLSGVHPHGEEGDNTFAAPSIDQVIAAEIGNETLYRSLEFGAYAGAGISYNGPNSMNPPESSPLALYQRLFGDTFVEPGTDPTPDPRLALRRSAIDAVMDRVTALQGRVGVTDKQRLDQHLSGLRDLELRLARMEAGPPDFAACVRPDDPVADPDSQDLLARNDLFSRMAAMAFACDQARVLSNVFTEPVNNFVFPGASAGHHQLTHDEVEPQTEVHDGVVLTMGALRSQIEHFDAIVEGEGTLLDNMVLLATSEVSLGRTHAIDEFPIVLAGNCGGVLREGIHYRSPTRENATSVIVSILRALDIVADGFGVDDARSEDGLSGIET